MNQGDGKVYCQYKCAKDSDCPGGASCQKNIVSKICTYPGSPSPSPPSPGGENPLHIKPQPRRSDNFFFITADWGAPAGKKYGCQKKVAQMMRDYRSKQEKKGKKLLFVAAGGDNFYYTGMGQKSKAYQFEHQWKSIYTSLTNVPWLAVYGNHDHGSPDSGCACGKGCNQHNSAGRPPGAEKYWMPDYYWHYLIPEIKLEVIGLDMNVVDLKKIGGSGCDHGAKETCKRCGGIKKIEEFLGKKKAEGEAYLDQRAKVTPATTVAIVQHYPGSVSKGLLQRFQKANRGKAKVLSAAGHAHDQKCEGSRTHGCDVILTGGGGGYVSGAKYLGFTAVHLTDDGGYEVVLETPEVRFSAKSCTWEDLETEDWEEFDIEEAEYMASLNHTMDEVYVI